MDKGKGIRQQIEESGNSRYNIISSKDIKEVLQDLSIQNDNYTTIGRKQNKEIVERFIDQFNSYEDYADFMIKAFNDYKKNYG